MPLEMLGRRFAKQSSVYLLGRARRFDRQLRKHDRQLRRVCAHREMLDHSLRPDLSSVHALRNQMGTISIRYFRSIPTNLRLS